MFKTANLRALCRTIGAGLFGMLLFAALSVSAQAAPRTVRVEEPGDGAHHFLLPPINLDVIKAFSDRVARAVRAGDDRSYGLWHAGNRVSSRFGTRGHGPRHRRVCRRR